MPARDVGNIDVRSNVPVIGYAMRVSGESSLPVRNRMDKMYGRDVARIVVDKAPDFISSAIASRRAVQKLIIAKKLSKYLGKAVYAGDTPRTLPSKLLRLLKMDHNPELAQTLPARELHELVTGDQYSAVFAELESLPDSDDATIKKERAEILGRLRGLKLAALKKYREKQKENPQLTAKTAKTKDVGHHRIPFSRIRHLIPARQRLSESLFTVATIRSNAGRAVLKDLIELYQSEFEVEARPWLRA
jgi:hypothetical protein